MRLTLKSFSIIILLIGFISVNQWSIFPLGNTYVEWLFVALAIIYCLQRKKHWETNILQKDNRLLNIYLLWLVFNVVRGGFVADNYWEYKQLVSGTITLSLPLLVYTFAEPAIVRKTLSVWLKYSILVFVLFFLWVITTDAYHFYLGPIFLLACFLPTLPIRWRCCVVVLLTVMFLADWDARSQVIKAFIALIMGVAFCYRRIITRPCYKIAYWICYLSPIVILYLGITGVFNPFENLSENEGKYVEKKTVDGQVVESDLAADTRTFIYEEVITSAIEHNYVIWGRTPARGNDSKAFGAFNAEELKTGKYERHTNELCHTNVFTWLGLIGVVLYSLIYVRSSYLAVFRSNSAAMRFVGIFVAFHWAYGWIEDFNRFDIMNISIWMAIAMGLSETFRAMDDNQFKAWLKTIFQKR